MSSLKTKFKQAFTTLLALAMLLAIAPVLPGSLSYAADNSSTYLELYTDASATEMTDEYSIDDLAIYIRANSAEEDENWPWLGLYEGALTSDTWSTSNLSMIWAYSDTSYGPQSVAYNGDNAVDLLGNGNSQGFGNEYSLSDIAPGTYTIILFKSYYDYGPIAYKQFTIKESSLPPVDFTIETDKTEYSASEPITVTTQYSGNGAWVGLYNGTKAKTDDFDDSYIDYYYCKDTNNGVANLTEKIKMTEDGDYTVALFSSGYNVEDVANFYAETPKLSLNKEGNPAKYKYGEPVLVSAKSGNPGAWVGVFEVGGEGFPDTYYGRFDVNSTATEVDILNKVSEAGNSLEYGKQYRLYLTQPIGGNPTDWVRNIKFELLTTYGDPTWQWDENFTTATATFTAKHDSSITKSVVVTGDGITSVVTKEATEDEEGIKTHTATITADMIDFATENDPPFTDSAEEAIPKLSHQHVISPVAAKDPTCTEPGHTAYYKCSGCNKFFKDADGNEEIEDKNSVVIKALGHDWSDWTKDQATYDDKNATRTHSRVCNREGCGVKETENCTFTHQPSSDPDIELYTCTDCGGQYEEVTVPVIKIEKSEYKYGEDIKVNVDINGHTEGWIALYHKGDAYYTSLMWYYPHVYPEKVLQTIDGQTDTGNQNLGEFSWDDKGNLPIGDYKLVYVTYPEKPYKLVGKPVYFSVVKEKKSEEITLEPTCTEPGNKHIVYDDDTEEDIEIPALGHDPKEEWTYIAEEKAHYHACSRCDEKLNKTACTFDDGKVTKEPTVKEEGEMTYTCTVCGGIYIEAIPTLVESGVKRVYGSTRYQTAILQANELKALLKVDKFDAVIVATGKNFADALSGAYLGYVKKAPILLVDGSSINEVKDYIKKNLVSGGTIYLLGGEAVVPSDVTAGMSEFTPKRLFGATRYETNIEILKEAGVKSEDVMICDGNNFADSLSASAAKRPIFLVNKSLNQTQRDYLDTLRTRKYYLVGGTGALPEALESDINTNFGGTTRLGGKDRYETSVKIAEALFSAPSKAVLAYGDNYPDGLCGGTLAAYMEAPLLLVRNDKAATTEGYISSEEVKSGIVLGGPSLISDDSTRSIFGLNDTDQIYVVDK